MIAAITTIIKVSFVFFLFPEIKNSTCEEMCKNHNGGSGFLNSRVSLSTFTIMQIKDKKKPTITHFV